MCEEQLSRIADKLARYSPKPLRPVLSPGELAAFEARYGITLPSGYRSFLLQMGNGGPGPPYGLFSLEEGFAYYSEHKRLDFLKRPFPHTAAYNPDEDPYWEELDRKTEAGEISEEEFDRLLDYVAAGTLIICHEGCGYMHRLVVTGPQRGMIWIDAQCSDQGLLPLNVSFLDWYERWLDNVLAGGSGAWWLM